MATVRLSGSEKRALVLWVLAGVVGWWYAQRHFFDAFPEASVNFKVTRAEALGRAKSFVTSLQHNVADYRTAIVFGVDDNAKTYLEREVGLKEANRLMASELNVWNWEVRFFKPEQEEEFQVSVNPAGEVTGYLHKIPEAQTGGAPEREAAHKTAQEFLTAKLGKKPAEWDFLPEEANSQKKPNRSDWTFTWEKHGFKAKDAPDRLKIELHGNEIGGADETLKVPEKWERDYKHLRSTNEFYNTVAIIPYLLLLGAVVWVGIQLTRQGQTSWKLALQLGVLVTVLLTAMQLNKWPSDAMNYRTTDAYGSFIIMTVFAALAFGLVSALTVSLVLPGGEPLYREAKPQFLRLRNVLSLRGIRSKEFFSATVIGLSLAAAQMGFLVAFYLIANHFGAWAPQEIKYDDSLNTSIPWIGGLAIGLLAATSEEFLFRLFAIPFLQKYTKSNVLAVVLPAFAWGFLHTAYPNEPPYIRGLEVGLIGVAVGIVYLRWGIVTTLIWHYTVDACLVGLLLIRSSSAYYKLSGIVIGLLVLLPFAISVYSRLTRGGFEDDSDLINAAPEAPEAEVEQREERVLTAAPTGALTPALIGLLVVCMALGGLAVWKLKSPRIGTYLKLTVDAKDASRLSAEALRKVGGDPAKFHSSTTFADRTDATASEYLRQKIGVIALNDIYEKKIPGALWNTRFFRDGEAEEYIVLLRPDGSAESVIHKLAENTPGATLTKDEAVARATAYLQSVKGLHLSRWALVDSTSDKKPQRLDHKLVWQENEPLDGPGAADADDSTRHAYERVQVSVLGDEVANFRSSVKIPDDWRRKQDEQSVLRTLHSAFVVCSGLGLLAAVLYFFLREIKRDLMRRLPWRRFTVWGLFGMIAYVFVVLFGNKFATAINTQYNTTMPLKFMYGVMGIGSVIGAFFYVGFVVFVFAVAWLFLRQAFTNEELPGWSGMPKHYYRDALLIGLGGTGALVALGRTTEWIGSHWTTQHRAVGASFGLDFDSMLPGVSISAASVLHGLMYAGLVAAISALVAAHFKSPVLRVALFVMGSLAMVGDWGSNADFAKQWAESALFLAVVAFGVAKVARLNLLGYFLVLAISRALEGAVEMLSQPNGFYHTQGIICVVALAGLVAWPLLAWLTAKGPSESTRGAAATAS